MKNIKVSAKLLLGFGIVAALTIVVGILGIYSLTSMDASYTDGIERHGYPLATMGKALSSLYSADTDMSDTMLYVGDTEKLRATETRALASLKTFETEIENYRVTIASPAAKDLFASGMKLYDEQYKPTILSTIAAAKNGATAEELKPNLDVTRTAGDAMANFFIQTMDTKLSTLEQLNDASGVQTHRLFVIVLSICLLSAAAAIFLGLYISGLISKPLKDMMGYIKQAGETGNLKFHDEEWANCDRLSNSKDEIGQTMKAFTQMLRKFVYFGEAVTKVANQNLTIEVETLGPNDTFGNALREMVDNLSHVFSEMRESSTQVTTGAKQIADGAQSLAQGSTEQAASIEQLSSSITEIAEMTKENAEIAGKTARLSVSIKENAEKGSHQMDDMILAVNEINEASRSISKIIKTIDDIAFQTNILALNAAVEAARAGQHGKGFAVVAEEVRNLASKSAEAAKDTGNMILNSTEKAELGARIAGETAMSLKEIVTGINESSQLVEEIASASEQQSMGISQINTGIDQVADVVQQNSATAQESAAASEEMSSLSDALQQLIAQFKLKNSTYRDLSETE